ncbi:biliverdin-producing heme oxygenase [Marinobacter nanhaiticus D15-8W]|uniref:biliverdin-producing heme oxygenase n=1 Tax=Marinobacter nanhaiticus TaxID=1305740 RepID=UPI0002C91C92|nr:biliverdin-producing heme oxygenase [Marinobacter nanhaiticus]BES70150.1 biliverdin-producing heme oxygenase [Marinobacter nanhaiticus D15-8W]
MQIVEAVNARSAEATGSRSNPLLAELRQATEISHQAIERNPRLKQLFTSDLSVTAYRQLLADLLGFYEPVEAQLDCAALLLSDADRKAIALTTEGRWKTPWLRHDLRNLGLSDEAIAGLPRAPRSECPGIEGLPSVIGCLYVLEGATLGGKLISRQIESCLDITAANGGRFYHGYGPDNGPMWGRFRQQLANLDMDASQTAKITTAAVETFSALDRWLMREE